MRCFYNNTVFPRIVVPLILFPWNYRSLQYICVFFLLLGSSVPSYSCPLYYTFPSYYRSLISASLRIIVPYVWKFPWCCYTIVMMLYGIIVPSYFHLSYIYDFTWALEILYIRPSLLDNFHSTWRYYAPKRYFSQYSSRKGWRWQCNGQFVCWRTIVLEWAWIWQLPISHLNHNTSNAKDGVNA